MRRPDLEFRFGGRGWCNVTQRYGGKLEVRRGGKVIELESMVEKLFCV